MVSILVLLDSLLRPSPYVHPCASTISVSILVLLDSLLRLCHKAHIDCTNGFQSLFCWIPYSDHQGRARKLSIRRMVSILVLLDSLLRHTPTVKPGRLSPCCFNPCFVGFPTQTMPSSSARISSRPAFQSLFCWIPYSDCVIRRISTAPMGFNPCFVGFPTQTTKDEHGSYRYGGWFQSLFCWIPYSDLSMPPLRSFHVSYVSILVLLDSLLRLTPFFLFVCCFLSGFNPCFVGFPTQTWALNCFSSSVRVSILVLLDSLLRLSTETGGCWPLIQFQSLFCWIPYSDGTRLLVGLTTLPSFNPCFVGFPTQT